MVNIRWIGSPNHTHGRHGHRVTRITLHIMQGHLAGTDSTFQDRRRQTSSTYGIGGDGTIHQYVSESDAPWSDGSMASNLQTISIEHEGGLPGVPCTQACVHASARLCADIARRHGWHRLTRGVNVFLHRDIPPYSHPDCPDRCVNGLPWAQVINEANEILSGNGNGGNDMNAGDIWNYPIGQDATPGNGNLEAWKRLSWVHHDTAGLYAELCRHDDGGTKDGTNGGLYTRVCYMDKRIREMRAIIDQQSKAIGELTALVRALPGKKD